MSCGKTFARILFIAVAYGIRVTFEEHSVLVGNVIAIRRGSCACVVDFEAKRVVNLGFLQGRSINER